jgi:hypothetical protein
MLSITVDPQQKYPQIRWPRELMTEGFSGTLPLLNDSITLIIFHPAASLEQVKKSLELKVKDLELRLEKEKVAASNGAR